MTWFSVRSLRSGFFSNNFFKLFGKVSKGILFISMSLILKTHINLLKVNISDLKECSGQYSVWCPDNCPPDSYPLDNCPPDYCPLDNCPRGNLPPGWLPLDYYSWTITPKIIAPWQYTSGNCPWGKLPFGWLVAYIIAPRTNGP